MRLFCSFNCGGERFALKSVLTLLEQREFPAFFFLPTFFVPLTLPNPAGNKGTPWTWTAKVVYAPYYFGRSGGTTLWIPCVFHPTPTRRAVRSRAVV